MWKLPTDLAGLYPNNKGMSKIVWGKSKKGRIKPAVYNFYKLRWQWYLSGLPADSLVEWREVSK